MSSEAGRTVELRLRAAVESSPSGLLMVDAAGRIVLVNREVERLFGYAREELLGQSVELLVPEGMRETHAGDRAGFLADPKVRSMGAGRDLYGRRKDGTEVPVEIGLTPVVTDEGIFVLGAVVDITARKEAEERRRRLEAQLRQAQKLEAVGTLAGGIAHDFNNVLAVIIGYAELLSASLSEGSAREDLAELLAAADRGKKLVERILSFSRRHESAPKPLELKATVGEACDLLRATLPAAIETRIHADPATPRVLADATSVHQVVMNLGTNAAHAMAGGGTLDVHVEPVYVRDNVARLHPELHEGAYAVLRVTDSGVGIDPSIVERVFEPFFTTKEAGKGTGLGLAVVHSIMREHGGSVELESPPGGGTVVRCYFPALEAPAEEQAIVIPPTHRGSGERILFVDDEASLATVGKRRLDSLGYRVSAFTDGRSALAAFRADPQAWDAVVTDYSMPGLDGLELTRRLRELRSDLPVLVLTGYMDDLPAAEIAAAGVAFVAKKPLTLDQIAEALHRVLNERDDDRH